MNPVIFPPNTVCNTFVGTDLIAGFRSRHKAELMCRIQEMEGGNSTALFFRESEPAKVFASPYDFQSLQPGGCLCCGNSIRFQQELRMLMEKTKPERLELELLETEKLEDMTSALRQSHAAHFRVQRCIYVLSGRPFLRRWDVSAGFAGAQLAASSAIVLYETDCLTEAEQERLRGILAFSAPQVPCWKAEALERDGFCKGRLRRKKGVAQ